MQQGDLDAWRSLYACYLPTLWRFVSTKTDDMHAAEDIVSETMLAFISAADGMDAESNIFGWLKTVAHNKVNDHYRKQFRRAQLLQEVAQSKAARDTCDKDLLAASETRDDVLQTLEQLTDQERLALEWKYLDGVPVKSIAERLGLTGKATESLLYRGRRAFRQWYEARQRAHEQKSIADRSGRTLKS